MPANCRLVYPLTFKSRVGPRRLARSLLLSLYRGLKRPSAVFSDRRADTSDSHTSDSRSSVEGKPKKDSALAPVVDPELFDALRSSPGVSEKGLGTSTTLGDIDSAGKTPSEDIPLRPEGEAEAQKLPLRPGPSVTVEEAGPEEAGPVQARAYKYLLVDDNDINLKILASFMKRLGHQYDTAVNGLEALQMYTSHPGLYQVVLMGKLVSPAHEISAG